MWIYFVGINNSFNTNFTPITCEVRRNQVTVSTAGTHGLKTDDTVIVEVNPDNTGIVTVKYNERRSLGIPDTSVMLEGDNAYVYKVIENNNVNKVKIETGIRNKGSVEVISGLSEGDIIVAEGLKKINPRGKIKPINK